jgi:hypothetical protein
VDLEAETAIVFFCRFPDLSARSDPQGSAGLNCIPAVQMTIKVYVVQLTDTGCEMVCVLMRKDVSIDRRPRCRAKGIVLPFCI